MDKSDKHRPLPTGDDRRNGGQFRVVLEAMVAERKDASRPSVA